MRDEKGQALILVLILLLIGSLIIAPHLGYMATGLKAGRVHEERMLELYAADAGVEDALYQIMNDQVPPDPYSLIVNDKHVSVDIALEEDREGFVDELLNENYSGVHSPWTVVTENVTADTYTMYVSYNGSASNKFVDGIGAWLQGTYTGGNSTGITEDYPNYDLTVDPNYKGGTAFVWKWTGGDRPVFGATSGVYFRTMSFQFAPTGIPEIHFSWAVVDSANVGVVLGGETFEVWKVAATATDNITEKQTEVTSYVLRQGGEVSIITWETSLK